MKENYLIDEQYLSSKGLNLEDYLVDGTLAYAIINIGLDLLIDRMCQIGNQFHSEHDIEEYLEKNDERTPQEKQDAFFKAQYRIIYNLVFTAETNPVDQYVDGILVYQLGCKIHGFQKGLYYKVNQ